VNTVTSRFRSTRKPTGSGLAEGSVFAAHSVISHLSSLALGVKGFCRFSERPVSLSYQKVRFIGGMIREHFLRASVGRAKRSVPTTHPLFLKEKVR